MSMRDNVRTYIKPAIWAEVIVGGLLLLVGFIYPDYVYVCFAAMLIISVIILFICYKKVEHHANNTMEKVDDTIQSLISGQSVEYFNQNKDTLLGKFQVSIIKLYDILQSYEAHEKKLRKQMNKNISNLTHQINTPITNIQIYSGFLSQEDLSEEEQKEFIENINRQASKLSWFGESFSKISRLETGIIELHPAMNELLPVILSAINQISLMAKEHDNEIILRGKQTLTAFFDSKWTEEIFFNLLDNAVKYSHRGSQVIVEMIPYELYIRVDVKSYGLKIAKEELTHIFKRFYRSEQVKDQEGVGLGLYLVRKILEEEKGYIKVETSHTKSSLAENESVFSVFLLKDKI